MICQVFLAKSGGIFIKLDLRAADNKGWRIREAIWKLRRYEPLDNGLKREVGYNEYSKAEKAAILASYNYDNQLKYQNQILLFMINLCEIMEFVTEQKNILHLDIKPENIMVTRYGKELVQHCRNNSE